jgi:hypothetical protein
MTQSPPQSQDLTHWSVLAGREPQTPTSRELNRFHGQKNGPSVNAGCLRDDPAFPSAAAVG